MTRCKISIVLGLAVVSLFWVSGSSAQQDSVGDLGLAARQDDLDSYWLDSRNWYSYGYRPYAKVHLSRFAPSLPAWNGANAGGYSFGINESAGNAPWEGGPAVKFQLNQNGTWH